MKIEKKLKNLSRPNLTKYQIYELNTTNSLALMKLETLKH